ncbi:MAG: ferredoxin family protein [Deltaproteobacteria bacterium]|nr:ferredoxin family protein [Deltaproteobacteria bacterium]MBW2137287.1 ferredoxin family protein [Deltaproteobacteria bacterium]
MKATHGPKIDYRRCNGCGVCYNMCPQDVYGWDKDRDQPSISYPGECWHCGICEIDCPEKAIDVQLALQAKLFLGIDP